MNTTTQADQAQAPAAEAQVLGGVVPYLSIDGAVKAAAFYAKAFDAKEVARHPVDEQGRTMHLHLHINGGSVMLSDPYPEHGYGLKTPQGFNLLIPVGDIDKWWKRAVDAGMEVTMPLQLMFWRPLRVAARSVRRRVVVQLFPRRDLSAHRAPPARFRRAGAGLPAFDRLELSRSPVARRPAPRARRDARWPRPPICSGSSARRQSTRRPNAFFP